MVTEQEEEEQQLAAQRVDVFVRSEDEAEWQAVGQGTVMWMPDGDRQRLMVLGGEEEASARPLGSVVLPSERPVPTPHTPHERHSPAPASDALACRRRPAGPGVTFSISEEANLITWASEGGDSYAMAFHSPSGCAQVWADLQVVLSSDMDDPTNIYSEPLALPAPTPS